ncbi:MAG: alpha/beta hydrolase [Pseudomonadota bacterium]
MYLAPIPTQDDAPTATLQHLNLNAGKKVISARVQIPARINLDLAPLIALHGISRSASEIYRAFGPECDRAGRVLIIPRFGRKHWSHFQTIGRHRPDQALLALMDHLRQTGVISTPRVSLFGYSGGAQLSHRFAMLYPQLISSLHVAASGWYCAPDYTQAFPMGVGQPSAATGLNAASIAARQLRLFLKLPIHIYVGSEDIQRDDNLRKDPVLDALQGRNRLARARSYIASLRRAAEARSILPDMDFTEVPGCAHDFSTCAQGGMARLVCTR